MLRYLYQRDSCNSEFFQTRSLIDNDAETPVFTDTEQKLLRLGLDPAAHPGEVAGCATKLFESLRRRDVHAEQVIRSFARATHAARELASARGYVVNFGRYEGKTVGELPRDYVVWALKKCDNLSFNLRKAMRLVLENNR